MVRLFNGNTTNNVLEVCGTSSEANIPLSSLRTDMNTLASSSFGMTVVESRGKRKAVGASPNRIVDMFELKATEETVYAIENFFYAAGIPFHSTRSSYYEAIAKEAKVGTSYAPPRDAKLRTTILDINYSKVNLLMEEMKEPLQVMIMTQDWTRWRESKTEQGKRVKEVVVRETFWVDVKYITSIITPVFSVIKYGDSNNSNLGEIYECIDSMFGQIKVTIRVRDPTLEFYHEHIQPVIQLRWEKLNNPLHMAVYALNPKWYVERPGRVIPLDDDEAEKVELETTVVDESQHNAKEQDASGGSGNGRYSEGTATDSDEENESQDGVDGETDEDVDTFFDTKDYLSSESLRSTSSGYARQSTDSHDGILGDREFFHSSSVNGRGVDMERIGLDYPYVERRAKLPEPKEKEKAVGLWSIIKDNIGKDLSGVCLPVYFNEPLSSLQKCFEDLEYSYLIDRASEWGKQRNSLMRILNVAAFAVSGYASTEGRHCKPFNPLLGETYEADYPDKGLRFFSEKVSHHPMVVACHCEGRGWKFWGDSNLKGKFWGRSIQLDPVGVLSLKFDDGESFQWSKVTTSIYNIILGKLYCDHYGTMRIQGSGDYSCKLKFKEQSIIDRNPHQVQGFVQDRNGNKVATLIGKWDDSMYYVLGDVTTKPKGYDPMSEACLLWKRNKSPANNSRYNFTPFAIALNELTPDLKQKLPPTDSRLRPDQRHLENGEYELANTEKLRLEQSQRQSRKLQERGWQPRWFRKEKGKDMYEYIGGYWEARDQSKWEGFPDIF
ncbi:hypothetical protein KI387_003464, partial [Taxus chinensis]